ncbi:hypothetical protein Acr_00g0007250 [Actinidia rufa]|uniref:Uncharacterized protein n=1 Tax=Actinidia rufa TaxID=165716 RepID=A0A7J0D9Z8_9ERIC|nr:hypothetical protein Acr_00g0007250 [Actinidia rufa]
MAATVTIHNPCIAVNHHQRPSPLIPSLPLRQPLNPPSPFTGIANSCVTGNKKWWQRQRWREGGGVRLWGRGKRWQGLLDMAEVGSRVRSGEGTRASDYDVNVEDEARRLKKEMEITIQVLQKSKFYSDFVGQLRDNWILQSNTRRVLGDSSSMQMVIYGLGSLEYNYVSQYQLALALLLRRDFSWIGGVEVFDPQMSPADWDPPKDIRLQLRRLNDKLNRHPRDYRHLKNFAEKFFAEPFYNTDPIEPFGCGKGTGHGPAGFGGIFRDEHKNCLVMYSGHLGEVDSVVANAEALRQGLRCLQFMSPVRKLIVEGDELNVIRWVNAGPDPPLSIAEVLFEISTSLVGIETLIHYVYEEANSSAVELAQRDHGIHGDVNLEDEEVRSVLTVNKHCKRQVEKPTLFYLPYLDKDLMGNLLEVNWWPERLNKMVVLANSFEALSEQCKKTSTTTMSNGKFYSLLRERLKLHSLEERYVMEPFNNTGPSVYDWSARNLTDRDTRRGDELRIIRRVNNGPEPSTRVAEPLSEIFELLVGIEPAGRHVYEEANSKAVELAKRGTRLPSFCVGISPSSEDLFG